MGIHAKYSGSNAHRFPNCSGQVALAATLPEMPESEYAAEGTKAHLLLSSTLQKTGPIGGWFEEEMFEAVNDVLDYVKALREQFPDLQVFSELQVLFPQNVVPAMDAAGYCDVLCISKNAKRAWVIDFKYGIGEVVEVEGNEQALFYATGAVWDLKYIETITLVIIQPRTYMDEWLRESDVTMLDLIEFSGVIEDAIVAAEQPDAPLIPGKWCHWCPAAVACPVAEKTALSILGVSNVQATLPPPSSIDIVRIGAIRARSDYIRSWLKEVEDYAYAQARSGVHVPGAKLVLAQGRRSWDDKSRATAEKLWEIAEYKVPIEQLMVHQTIGITKAEELVLKAIKPNGKEAVKQAKREMAFLTTRSSSGTIRLVDESDPRPAYSEAVADFAGVTIEHVPNRISAVPPNAELGSGASTRDGVLLAPPAPLAMWYGAQDAGEPDIDQLSQYQRDLE